MKSVEPSKRAQVTGNTFRVFVYLLKQGPSELRKVQRGLGLSTASLASYHLEKLISSGYVVQNERGEYCANRDSSGEILDGFAKIGVLLVPQLLFVAVLFTPIVVFFGYMSLYQPQFVPELVAASGLLVAVTWYETLRVWRKLSTFD